MRRRKAVSGDSMVPTRGTQLKSGKSLFGKHQTQGCRTFRGEGRYNAPGLRKEKKNPRRRIPLEKGLRNGKVLGFSWGESRVGGREIARSSNKATRKMETYLFRVTPRQKQAKKKGDPLVIVSKGSSRRTKRGKESITRKKGALQPQKRKKNRYFPT